MPDKPKGKTPRRNGGWNHDSICRALVWGYWELRESSYKRTVYGRTHRGMELRVVVPYADKPLAHWSQPKWRAFLDDNQLRITKTGDGRDALVPYG